MDEPSSPVPPPPSDDLGGGRRKPIKEMTREELLEEAARQQAEHDRIKAEQSEQQLQDHGIHNNPQQNIPDQPYYEGDTDEEGG